MITNPNSPLHVHWRHFPKQLPWFMRFLATSRQKKVTDIADALQSMMQVLMEAYHPLLDMSGADCLVQQRGRLQVHESAETFNGARFGINMRRERGIQVDELSGDEVRELEPALGNKIYAAYHLPNAYTCTDPSEMVQRFARALSQNGGTVIREEARALEDVGDGKGRVVTNNSRHTADVIVIAAGAWSAKLVKPLRVRVPIIAERGYHVTLPRDGVGLKIPFTAGDRYVTASPMQNGLRICGMAEYADVDTPSNWNLANRLLVQAKELLPGLSDHDKLYWQGPRPSTPDNMPVIDQVKSFPWAYLAFGHGHIGLGTGAITGKLISQLVTGQVPDVDLSPFRHDRLYY